jgi:pimeloyl-ACP methyl ester carboxylesterase
MPVSARSWAGWPKHEPAPGRSVQAGAVSTFVLVHGAWHGAWIWRRVLPVLRAAGQTAHAVTLTGLGERAHLLGPGITLATHVADVLGLIDAEELDDVVLVGHSYGGLVVTQAADALLAAAPPRLQRLIYVDAQLALPGEAWSTLHAPAVQAERRAAAQANGGALPPPDPALFGLSGADHAWLTRRQRPHPFGPYDEPLSYDAGRQARLPRSYIACLGPALGTAAAHHARVRSWPGWDVVEMATGHCPMVSAPAELAALLLARA